MDGESNTIRIGFNNTAAYIAGISGEQALGGDAMFVTSAGKLGTVTALSSVRFKDDIKPMGNTSDAILTLKPVTFRYKKELDPQRHAAVWPRGRRSRESKSGLGGAIPDNQRGKPRRGRPANLKLVPHLSRAPGNIQV